MKSMLFNSFREKLFVQKKLIDDLSSKKITFDQYREMLFKYCIRLAIRSFIIIAVFFESILLLSQMSGKSTLKVSLWEAFFVLIGISAMMAVFIAVRKYFRNLIWMGSIVKDRRDIESY